MKFNSAFLQAVIAKYHHFFIFILFWHLHRFNLSINMFFNHQGVNNTFLAHRTRNIVLIQVIIIAISMHSMPAPQNSGRTPRLLHIFHAHTAILFQFFLRARVIVFQKDAQAALAGVAVESVFAAAHPADATPLAVVNLFGLEVVIVEDADFAEIAGELDPAILAIF